MWASTRRQISLILDWRSALDVVLYSIGVGVGGMEIIDKFACCRKISRVEKIRVLRDEPLSRVIFGAIWA